PRLHDGALVGHRLAPAVGAPNPGALSWSAHAPRHRRILVGATHARLPARRGTERVTRRRVVGPRIPPHQNALALGAAAAEGDDSVLRSALRRSLVSGAAPRRRRAGPQRTDTSKR